MRTKFSPQDQLIQNLPPRTSVPAKRPSLITDDTYCPPSLKTGQVAVQLTPVPICSSRAQRAVIVLTNMTGSDVYIGTDNTVSSTGGDLLPGGKGATKSYPTQSALWCIGLVAGQISFAEYHN